MLIYVAKTKEHTTGGRGRWGEFGAILKHLHFIIWFTQFRVQPDQTFRLLDHISIRKDPGRETLRVWSTLDKLETAYTNMSTKSWYIFQI